MAALVAQKPNLILNFIQNRIVLPVSDFAQSVKQVFDKVFNQPVTAFSNLINQAQNKIKEMLEKIPKYC